MIGNLRSFLENRPIEDIHLAWIREHLKDDSIKTLDQAKYAVKYGWDLFNVENPARY